MFYCGRKYPNTGKGGGDSLSTKWQYFGATQKIVFACDLETLLEKEQMFYELYIQKKNNEYSPVPVRIVNLISEGRNPNAKLPVVPLCDTDDIIVKRFFLWDIVSGVTEVNSRGGKTVETIRYADYISLEASLVTNKFARIYPPVLTIRYREVNPAEWNNAPQDTVYFSMYYTMNNTEFFTNFRIFFILIMVITGLFFALRYRHWQQRNSRVVTTAVLTTDLGGFNMSTLTEMALIATNTWTLVFFPVQICISWYFFAFFKIQAAPSVLLPPQNSIYSVDSPYYIFTVNLHVMFFFQLWYVLVMVYRQCRADMFFIDWEPMPSKPKAGDTHTSSHNTVSVWRTILVANEFTELQTVRKTDIRFTLFFLAFALIGTYYLTYLTFLVLPSESEFFSLFI
jgi:meckelin